MIRRIVIRISFFFAALVLTGSCIERFSPPTTTTQFGYLVVDGFLNNGTDSTIIKLSRTQTLINTPDDVAELNALVQIEEEDGIVFTLKNNSKGTYSIAPLNLDFTKKYRLKIKTSDTKEYISDFVPIRKSPPLDKISFTNEKDAVRFSLDTHDPENEATYYFWTYEETWKYKAKDYSIYKYENGQVVQRDRSDELFFCWKTIGSNKLSVFSTKNLGSDVVSDYNLFTVPYNSRKLYFEYSLRVIQHVLTEEAYQYWVNTIKNSENMGSIYAPIPSQVTGNIHSTSNPNEPVIGYFSASSIGSNRLSITRDDVPQPSGLYEPDGYENCGEYFVSVSRTSTLTSVLIVDKRYNDATQELTGYLVSTRDCLDCREKGGVTTRPPYWN